MEQQAKPAEKQVFLGRDEAATGMAALFPVLPAGGPTKVINLLLLMNHVLSKQAVFA